MQRASRIAASFAIIVVAYWAYALLAVPWIEPPAAPPPAVGQPGNVAQQQPPDDIVDHQIDSLRDFFKPGAWELKDPIVLEIEHAKLLLQEYHNLGDGRVDIPSCTIVIPYEGAADNEAQRHRQTMILEAPDGAVLQFDQPLEITKAKAGRLVGGLLRGKVTIRSDWKEPGPEDDLLIETNDVQLSERTISTPNPVDFRWGPHFGRGHDMVITLLAGQSKPGGVVGGPNVAGIESFEMRHVERLHLDLGWAAPAASRSPEKTDASVPVEIRCRGPFYFDVVHRVATFRDGVDVMKQNSSGPSDQIACQLLSLYFIETPKPGVDPSNAAAPKTTGSLDLVAQRLEARGNPVVVTAPSRKNLVVCGPRIEYNLLTNSIAVDGVDGANGANSVNEVFLQQGASEIHARSLLYQPAVDGRLGLVTSQGPGWLRGQSDDHPEQQLEAKWKDQLLIRPRQQYQEILFSGGAELTFQGVGGLQAREIFFWLLKTPSTTKNGQTDLRAHSLLARNDVHLHSAQMAGKVDLLEVGFDQEGGEQGPAAGGLGGTMSGHPVTVTPGAAVAGLSDSPPSSSDIGPIEVTGRVLRARVALGRQQTVVTGLSIEDNVQILESPTMQPGQRPLLIRGDRLDAVNPSAPNGVVTVTGRPARFEWRGRGLTGSNINLDRGANRLWIAGAGQMDAPMDADLDGRPLAVPAMLTVDWHRRMEFDGRTARFEGAVAAAVPRLQSAAEITQFQMNTEKMDIQLQRSIRFADPKTQDRPQVESLRCLESTLIENRAFDARQQPPQQSSFNRMQVANLDINVRNGEIKAGPGWLNRVGYGTGHSFGGAGNTIGNAAGPANTAAIGAAATQLYGLHIDFQGGITGNIDFQGGNFFRRQLTFHDNVRLAYGPVERWDAMLAVGNPDQLGPHGATLSCDRLEVDQSLLPTGSGQRAVELVAEGNAVAENTTFIARGNRITYAEAKGLLILEGDGRNDAELWQQQQVGAPASKHTGKKFWYWPETQRFSADGAQSLEIGQWPGGSR